VLLNALTAISPIDGRYFQTTAPLARYFSEFALMQYRVRVEVEYFIALCGVLPELKHFPHEKFNTLRAFLCWSLAFLITLLL
jgi:adenylosuccinate lyase